MEFRQLEYFLKICECGSMSRAADKLFISQQALSKSVDSLEKDLGVTLFCRNGRALELTRCGELLRSGGLRLIRQRDAACHHLTALAEADQPVLTIAFFSGMVTQYPTTFFQDFMDDYPDVSFRFISYYDNDYNRQHIHMDVDLFFTSEPLFQTDMQLLYQSQRPFYALVNRDHPLTSKRMLKISDLKGHYVISINSDFPDREQMHHTLKQNGVEIASQLSDADLTISDYLVLKKDAVAFFAGPASMIPEGMVRLPLADPRLQYHCYIYGQPGIQPAPVRNLISRIQAFRNQD